MIALDTSLFIYVLESHPEFGPKAAAVLRQAQGNGTASMLVYLELLSSGVFRQVKPRQIALSFLDIQSLEYKEVQKPVLLRAAQLRSQSEARLELGDAVHLASALEAGASEFITNDRALAKLNIRGLRIQYL